MYTYTPGSGFITGVPARDITQEEFDALSEDLQAAVKSGASYKKAATSGRTGQKASPAPVADEAADAVKEQ